ncbi:hypothetical protein AB0912_05115 [Streptomyces sp. NPDC007084]|uniref:hypothetical protein n=1 Tax=Streptomyces sp. NPDC007084 TaxID=3154313 RepID=UPI003453333F
MRRTTPTRTIALTALTLLLAAGCGTRGGSEAGGSGTVSPSSAPPSSPSSPGSASPTSPNSPPPPSPSEPSSPSSGRDCPPVKGELGAADTGHTYCLAVGDTVRVTLDGTTPRPWKPVKSAGGALEPANSGIVLQPGDATAAYRAVAAGTVELTSSRPMCPSDPARMSCKGLQEWTVTVVVRKA